MSSCHKIGRRISGAKRKNTQASFFIFARKRLGKIYVAKLCLRKFMIALVSFSGWSIATKV